MGVCCSVTSFMAPDGTTREKGSLSAAASASASSSQQRVGSLPMSVVSSQEGSEVSSPRGNHRRRRLSSGGSSNTEPHSSSRNGRAESGDAAGNDRFVDAFEHGLQEDPRSFASPAAATMSPLPIRSVREDSDVIGPSSSQRIHSGPRLSLLLRPTAGQRGDGHASATEMVAASLRRSSSELHRDRVHMMSAAAPPQHQQQIAQHNHHTGAAPNPLHHRHHRLRLLADDEATQRCVVVPRQPPATSLPSSNATAQSSASTATVPAQGGPRRYTTSDGVTVAVHHHVNNLNTITNAFLVQQHLQFEAQLQLHQDDDEKRRRMGFAEGSSTPASISSAQDDSCNHHRGASRNSTDPYNNTRKDDVGGVASSPAASFSSGWREDGGMTSGGSSSQGTSPHSRFFFATASPQPSSSSTNHFYFPPSGRRSVGGGGTGTSFSFQSRRANSTVRFESFVVYVTDTAPVVDVPDSSKTTTPTTNNNNNNSMTTAASSLLSSVLSSSSSSSNSGNSGSAAIGNSSSFSSIGDVVVEPRQRHTSAATWSPSHSGLVGGDVERAESHRCVHPSSGDCRNCDITNRSNNSMAFEAVDGCFLHETRKETETTVLRQQAEHHTPPLAAPAQDYYASSTSSSCSVVGWPSHRHGLHLGGGGTTECSIPKHLASPSLSVCSTSATTMQLTTAPTSAASVSLSNESILSPMPPSSSVVSSSAAAFPQRRRRTATTSTTLGACPTAVLASIPSPRHNNSTDDNNNNDDYAPNLILRHTKHAANADHRQLHDKADNVDDDDDESIMSRPRVCPPPQPPSSYHKSDLRFVRDGTGVLLPLFAEAPVSSSPSAPTMSTIAGEAVSSWNGGVISVEALPSPPPPPPSAAQNSLRVSPLTLHVSHQQQLAAGYSLAGRRGVRSSTLHHQQYEAPIQKYPLSIYHHPHNLIPPPPALHRHTMQHPEEDFLFVDDAHDVGEESAGDEDELERCTVLTVGA